MASPAGSTSAGTGIGGPEGVYRVMLSPSDLLRSGDPNTSDRGAWTLGIMAGNWWMRQDETGAISTGTYTASGNRIRAVDGADPQCFGSTWSARWSENGTHLTFRDLSVRAACAGGGYEAFMRASLTIRPWARLGQLAFGG